VVVVVEEEVMMMMIEMVVAKGRLQMRMTQLTRLMIEDGW
jgi:hypothetical protein